MQLLIRCKRSLLAVIALSSLGIAVPAQEQPVAAPLALSPESSATPQTAAPASPPATPPQAPPQTSPSATQNSKPQSPDQPTSKDRLFYTLPNFLTLENAGQVPPLGAGEKFKVITRSSFDPAQFAWYGLLSGISQAENSEPGYGQGAQGYGKRYASALGDGLLEGYMVGAAFPALLHQDPRFFQSGKGGFWHRTGYAVSRILITRTDSGGSQFNYSEVVGSAVAAGISTYSYHPHEDKTLSNTATVWGTQMAYDTLAVVVKEFWPDIRRKIHKNKSLQQP